MVFETRDEWEVSDPIYKLLTGDSGVHRYPIVKISLNLNLFHLEICKHFKDEDVKIWERYIFVFINDVIDLLSAKEFDKIKISLQPACKLDGSDDSHITTITEIIEKEHNDQKAYIYKCRNGKTYFDSNNIEGEQASSEQTIIYADYT
jgi:hypothetical protein